MATLSFVLGIIGNVISILMFASPIKTFKEVVKKKSTENYKGVPYITTLLSTSLWTFYGLLKPGGLLIVTVNAAGAAMHILYVSLFLIYAPQNIKVKSLKLVGAVDVVFLGGVIVVTLFAIPGAHMRLTLVGLLCAGLTVAMYAAPLSAMFLNGAIWSAYALLVQDYYVGVPNGIGFLLGSAQLILYMIYRNKSTSDESAEKKDDEGSAHLFKSAIQMNDFNKNDDEMNTSTRSLYKGNSLPKSSSIRQYSQNIMKTFSLSPQELDQLTLKDIEKGLKESP